MRWVYPQIGICTCSCHSGAYARFASFIYAAGYMRGCVSKCRQCTCAFAMCRQHGMCFPTMQHSWAQTTCEVTCSPTHCVSSRKVEVDYCCQGANIFLEVQVSRRVGWKKAASTGGEANSWRQVQEPGWGPATDWRWQFGTRANSWNLTQVPLLRLCWPGAGVKIRSQGVRGWPNRHFQVRMRRGRSHRHPSEKLSS